MSKGEPPLDARAHEAPPRIDPVVRALAISKLSKPVTFAELGASDCQETRLQIDPATIMESCVRSMKADLLGQLLSYTCLVGMDLDARAKSYSEEFSRNPLYQEYQRLFAIV